MIVLINLELEWIYLICKIKIKRSENIVGLGIRFIGIR